MVVLLLVFVLVFVLVFGFIKINVNVVFFLFGLSDFSFLSLGFKFRFDVFVFILIGIFGVIVGFVKSMSKFGFIFGSIDFFVVDIVKFVKKLQVVFIIKFEDEQFDEECEGGKVFGQYIGEEICSK